jgi:uncharacterized protein (DUF2252 family)
MELVDRLRLTLESRADRRHAGRELRKRVPRAAHATWRAPPNRPDPVQTLIESGRGRIPHLLPVRYARMRPSPFTFLRGAAAVMAGDLATTPASLLMVQSCGDCHINNFGTFLTPEGRGVFDINDFDETLPAPFEWDLKRLAISLVVAAGTYGLSERHGRALAMTCVRSYREWMRQLAELPPLEAWQTSIDLEEAVAAIEAPRLRQRVEQRLSAGLKSARRGFDLTDTADGMPVIRDRRPDVFHIPAQERGARAAFARYGESLPPERRVLLDRYRLEDLAFKVVGVGSVGTFCAIGLFADADGATLLLQIKQATASVLEPFAGASVFANHGQRVVVGQRIMQAASDVFLGWTHDPESGRDLYVRRLKDSRLASVGAVIEEQALPFAARLCGRTLARAHARSGDAAAISGYMGHGESFDEAIASFAIAYAVQTEQDHQGFLAAIAAGRITASEAETA